jgi:hypothetical protein
MEALDDAQRREVMESIADILLYFAKTDAVTWNSIRPAFGGVLSRTITASKRRMAGATFSTT